MTDKHNKERWQEGELFAAMCSGKRPFDSALDAGRQKERMRRRKFSTAEVSVYRCPFCGHFHIGRPVRRKKKINRT